MYGGSNMGMGGPSGLPAGSFPGFAQQQGQAQNPLSMGAYGLNMMANGIGPNAMGQNPMQQRMLAAQQSGMAPQAQMPGAVGASGQPPQTGAAGSGLAGTPNVMPRPMPPPTQPMGAAQAPGGQGMSGPPNWAQNPRVPPQPNSQMQQTPPVGQYGSGNSYGLLSLSPWNRYARTPRDPTAMSSFPSAGY
jgi:hypothetical protein